MILKADWWTVSLGLSKNNHHWTHIEPSIKANLQLPEEITKFCRHPTYPEESELYEEHRHLTSIYHSVPFYSPSGPWPSPQWPFSPLLCDPNAPTPKKLAGSPDRIPDLVAYFHSLRSPVNDEIATREPAETTATNYAQNDNLASPNKNSILSAQQVDDISTEAPEIRKSGITTPFRSPRVQSMSSEAHRQMVEGAPFDSSQQSMDFDTFASRMELSNESGFLAYAPLSPGYQPGSPRLTSMEPESLTPDRTSLLFNSTLMSDFTLRSDFYASVEQPQLVGESGLEDTYNPHMSSPRRVQPDLYTPPDSDSSDDMNSNHSSRTGRKNYSQTFSNAAENHALGSKNNQKAALPTPEDSDTTIDLEMTDVGDVGGGDSQQELPITHEDEQKMLKDAWTEKQKKEKRKPRTKRTWEGRRYDLLNTVAMLLY